MALKTIVLLCLAAGAEAVVLKGTAAEEKSAGDSQPDSAGGVVASMHDVLAGELAGATSKLLNAQFGPEIVQEALNGRVGPDDPLVERAVARRVLNKLEEIAEGIASEYTARSAETDKEEAEDEGGADTVKGAGAVLERATAEAEHRVQEARREAASKIVDDAKDTIKKVGELRAGLGEENPEEKAEDAAEEAEEDREEAQEAFAKMAHGVETVVDAVAPVVDELLAALGRELDQDEE